MKTHLKLYITSQGEELLYCGSPSLDMLDELAQGPADLWHSSFEQGLKNAFPEIIYQTAVHWWYLNDFENIDTAVSWRINPYAFVVRKSVWDALGGFDDIYESDLMKAFAFGTNLLRNQGGVPLYAKGLFVNEVSVDNTIPKLDRYLYFRKHFKARHSTYMLLRQYGRHLFSELKAFQHAKKRVNFLTNYKTIPVRQLEEIKGQPTVSVIIPTMFRQDYTIQLLQDFARQNYPINQAIVVDATPQEERDESLYANLELPFELVVKWQTSQGSCRARNEAITLCNGDYIIFGDDDIRVPEDYVQKHIQLLQTYNAKACNGLDIRAEHHKQNLQDLKRLYASTDAWRKLSGASSSFSNANSCVERAYVNKLVGNDINYDGGYGEDGDFGLSLAKLGLVVLHNPLAMNLHLKPPSGGYRWWNSQALIIGKKRKKQPWELNHPVKTIVPKPSPTVMYQKVKHYKPKQINEYRNKYLFLYVFKGSKLGLPLRLLKLPYRLLQFKRSLFYAKNLHKLGIRYK